MRRANADLYNFINNNEKKNLFKFNELQTQITHNSIVSEKANGLSEKLYDMIEEKDKRLNTFKGVLDTI